MTQRMVPPAPPTLDRVDIDGLLEGDVRQGWKLLGISSEYVLNIVAAHHPDRPIPDLTIGQLFHYTGNQMMVRLAGIPSP